MSLLEQYRQKACNSMQDATLYIVATPIGNLADISLRALAVLSEADVVCAEDTRVTAQLLSAYGIRANLISVREHNEQQMADKIIALLSEGKKVAQVSDAGTPAVCDPGAKLVGRVRAAGFHVVPVVGASAVMGILSVAGISGADFYFHGFLPAKAGERQSRLREWEHVPYPVVMFETPHRIEAALADFAALLPERKLLLAREISKTFETFLDGTPAALQTVLANDRNQTRGEMALVLYPAEKTAQPDMLPENACNVMRILADALPLKQAAQLAAEITGERKNRLYDWALAQKKNDG